MDFKIAPLNQQLTALLQATIDQKTKPLGALGDIERLALQLGRIQNTTQPLLHNPTIVVCCADHGACVEGISAYPSAVTAQMVFNFLNAGAAINVFAAQNGLALTLVDAGVDYDFPPHEKLIAAKVAHGTQNYVSAPAMARGQCRAAIQNGVAIVNRLHASGCNIVGFGEMGIGNSASAALLMALLCDLPLTVCTGAGAGLDAAGVQHKVRVLERARQRILDAHSSTPDPLTLLAEAGGFEIATMCGGMLRAAELSMIVLLDGFISTAALLVAQALEPQVVNYCICSHRSAEKGHRVLLDRLGLSPLLDLQLRLGEGTGAALAYPLVRAAVAFLNNMASFASAGISSRRDV